ncbi:low temperature requirement protein A [Micromonospora globispora]|uniref:low temperature requirement protein A n=1 Tax=Micromonospora globispora TaxID=1450148 RepID=UPI001A9CAECD|nr:low temperature requirement protein A [Micromonospora globispora]
MRVWAFTSFEVTLLDIERRGTKGVTVTVMGLGLFMTAGIAQAFDDGPWLFVIPMLLSLAGPGGYAAATAPTPQLRHRSPLTQPAVVSPACSVSGPA